MTAREVFEGMLTELSKVNAPSMLLQDFNYFFNKAINQYINKRYNIYDEYQQSTDDLRVLKATTILNAKKSTDLENGPMSFLKEYTAGKSKIFGATYEVDLPDDYLHILNCVCIYKLTKNHKCYDKGNYVQFPAKRLTADSWSVIVNDYYNRPLPERPYFYIHNINNNIYTSTDESDTTDTFDKSDLGPTNSATDIVVKYGVTVDIATNNTDIEADDATVGTVDQTTTKTTDGTTTITSQTNFPRTIDLGSLWKGSETELSTVEREAGYRYGNASKVRLEIRYGQIYICIN